MFRASVSASNSRLWSSSISHHTWIAANCATLHLSTVERQKQKHTLYWRSALRRRRHAELFQCGSKNTVISLPQHELEAIMIISIREPPPLVQPVISSLQCPLERPPLSQLPLSSASRHPIIVHCSKLPLHRSAPVTKSPPLYLVISSHFVPNLSRG